MKFIDHAKISVKSGKGGDGCIAFLREKFRPKGGPSGGDGGNGGSIIFISDSKLTTLQDYSYKNQYFAKSGENGKGKNMHGKNAENIYLKVPIGTIIKDLKKIKLFMILKMMMKKLRFVRVVMVDLEMLDLNQTKIQHQELQMMVSKVSC